jgi:DNA-binding MarR family transcriptional regulator
MLRVALTIYEVLTNVTTPEPTEPTERSVLVAQLLDELARSGPKDAIRHMRQWPHGRLSLVHLNVLMTIDVDGSLPMSALAEALDVSQASVTGIVDRMEQRGLVERHRDDEDRRVVRVVVTDEGRSLVGRLAEQRREHLTQVLDELTDEELAGFLGGLRAFRRARERRYGTEGVTTE